MLIAEGARIARPALYLFSRQRRGKPFVGIWGGKGVAPPPPPRSENFAWKHRISVDSQWLADQGYDVAGCLSLYAEINLKEEVVHWWNATA